MEFLTYNFHARKSFKRPVLDLKKITLYRTNNLKTEKGTFVHFPVAFISLSPFFSIWISFE